MQLLALVGGRCAMAGSSQAREVVSRTECPLYLILVSISYHIPTKHLIALNTQEFLSQLFFV